MPKFSGPLPRLAIIPPNQLAGTTRTHEGAPALSRNARSDLFLLAVTNMVSEGTFYETASARDSRFRNLIQAATTEDPDWVARFVPFLRDTMQMRSAAVVVAAETVRHRLTARITGTIANRKIIDSACSRADEPAELLAYWVSRYGHVIPKPVKRGIADAAVRLYTERTALKYDGQSRAWRMADVINLTHPQPSAPWQEDLFKFLLGARYGDVQLRNFDRLPMIQAHRVLEDVPQADRGRFLDLLTATGQTDRLRAAGMAWEALSGWLGGPMDARAWSAVIPGMGYMALLRNLRNFDEAGVPDNVARSVAERLADPDQVAASRQFPFRFLSAYKAAPSLRWAWALERALDAAVPNIPELPGRSLVLIDTSGSMATSAISQRSTITPVDAAALFGLAVAKRNTGAVDVYGFGNDVFSHTVRPAESLLPAIKRFTARVGAAGHGTNIPGALGQYSGHDRVFLFSDMQTMNDDRHGYRTVPESVPIYAFNLGGYAPALPEMGRGNRHEFGGFSDAVFRMVPMLEAGMPAAIEQGRQNSL